MFRVREELRDGHDAHEAVERALLRVGESITASAATVIIALLTLLFASFGLYHDLGIPLAIGMAVMLLIGLTLLPALLAILGRKAFWPAKIVSGVQKEGSGARSPSKLVQRPKTTLIVGVIVFLASPRARSVTRPGASAAPPTRPRAHRAAQGNAALAEHFPHNSSNPANLVFKYADSVWQTPQTIAKARDLAAGLRAVQAAARPAEPERHDADPAAARAAYGKLGPPQNLPVRQPTSATVPPAHYNAYRATALFVSKNGR